MTTINTWYTVRISIYSVCYMRCGIYGANLTYNIKKTQETIYCELEYESDVLPRALEPSQTHASKERSIETHRLEDSADAAMAHV